MPLHSLPSTSLPHSRADVNNELGGTIVACALGPDGITPLQTVLCYPAARQPRHSFGLSRTLPALCMPVHHPTVLSSHAAHAVMYSLLLSSRGRWVLIGSCDPMVCPPYMTHLYTSSGLCCRGPPAQPGQGQVLGRRGRDHPERGVALLHLYPLILGLGLISTVLISIPRRFLGPHTLHGEYQACMYTLL